MPQVPFRAELLKTEVPKVIDLFMVDITILLPAFSTDQSQYYFTNWSNSGGQDLAFDGQVYTAIPLETQGFELKSTGQLERPSLTFGNVGLAITGLCNTYDDLIGATVTRTRTLSTYLDGADEADPEAFWGPDQYVVEFKKSETQLGVTFQLAIPFDLEGRSLPARRMVRESCPWIYRDSVGCGYTGTNYFNAQDEVVTQEFQDVCGKRLTSCKKRYGNATLPFGGFPGLVDANG